MQLDTHEYIDTDAPAAHDLLSELRRSALTAYERGESSAAEAAFLQFLDRFPDDVEVRQTLGILALQTGRHAWASQLLSQVAEIRDSADLQDALGAAYCGLSQLNEALRCFERAAAMQLSHAPARVHKAQVLSHLGRHAEAALSYARAIELGLDCAEIHKLYGEALAAIGKTRESVASYDRSLSQSCDVLSHSAAALNQVNNYEAALTAAEWVIALAPGEAVGAHQQRATALKGLERLLERSAVLAGAAPVVVSCLLSALLGSELARAAISVLDEKTRSVAAPAAARITKQRVDVDPIVTAHLFGEARENAAPEMLATLVADLRLTGTLTVDDPLGGFAIIGDAEKSRVYSVGDSFDGTTLREIHQDHVILERNGVSQSLRLPRPESGPQPAPADASHQ
jgi:tetratricopeptide (TPR) repeat protein